MTDSKPTDSKPIDAKSAPQRTRWLALLALAFLAAGVVWGMYWFTYASIHESTDDAYVVGNLIRVTPRIAGTVVAVLTDDTEPVKQGQVLVRLDDTDAHLALEKSEADLGSTVRRISQAFRRRDQQAANLAQKRRTLQQTEADLTRRLHAVTVQAVSKEEVEHAQAARDQAQWALDQAEAEWGASEAVVAGTSVETHPEVKQAAVRLRESWLTVQRCSIRSPADGQVAKRSVQIGQQVAPGVPLLIIVPTNQIWVDANCKEDQIKNIHPNQPVRLTSDLYGTALVFHGTVQGLSPGTGSVFSLLPPQNASGNWIKIIQRLPVRIALDPKELLAHPLRVGLSMKAEIETSVFNQAAPSPGTRYEIPIEDAKEAEALIQSVLQTNCPRCGRDHGK